MRLKIITPENLIFDERVDSVTLPGVLGQMTILPGHAMLVSELFSGRLYYRQTDKDGKEKITSYTIGKGFMEVQKDSVIVFTIPPFEKGGEGGFSIH